MKTEQNLYEPIISFEEQRPQMQLDTVHHDALYEKAFYSMEDTCKTEYALNTTTWD